MRPMTAEEVSRLSAITALGIRVGLLEPTATGLNKGIMDAIAEFRDFVRAERVHDYDRQPQGPDSKRLVPTRILTVDGSFDQTMTSMYRPLTKDGDPRAWVYGLPRYASPGEILAFIARNNLLYVFNLSRTDLQRARALSRELDDLLRALAPTKLAVVAELRRALQQIAEKGYLRVDATADTVVGMLLERELGLKPNSSRAPDYQGIEIKAARQGRGNRHNLFAKVPDWSRSPIQSSRAMLAAFGYQKEGRRQLYCTVSSQRPNSQGLSLAVDEAKGELWEISTSAVYPRVAAWDAKVLQDTLAAKHAETFWVHAESRRVGGGEEFRFVSADHTASPILQQLMPLIASGVVTMDHLVRETGAGVGERGPLFKLRNGALHELFPPAKHYDFVD